MGLVSDQEHGAREAALDAIADVVERCVKLDRVLDTARAAAPLAPTALVPWPERVCTPEQAPVIGYVHDAALWFYYPENLEALARAGAELRRVSLLSDEPWPELHGLYLGGGFPETQAAALSANVGIRSHVRALAEHGLPMYAECGGFMYLCRAVQLDDARHDLAGVFPLSTRLCAKPQGLGYVEALVEADTRSIRLACASAGMNSIILPALKPMLAPVCRPWRCGCCAGMECCPAGMVCSRAMSLLRTRTSTRWARRIGLRPSCARPCVSAPGTGQRPARPRAAPRAGLPSPYRTP